MLPTVFLVFVTSCLYSLATAETQSAVVASWSFGTSKQRQRNQQQLQHQLSSSFPIISTDQQTSRDETANNDSHIHFTLPKELKNHWVDSAKSPDTLASDISLRMNGDRHIDTVQDSHVDESKFSFRNDVEDFLHAPIRSDWGILQLPYNRQLFKNNYNSGDTPLSSRGHVDNKSIQRSDHRVDKRDVADSFLVGHEQTEPDFLDNDYPIYIDRRFQLFRPSNDHFSSPYLSAEEFKETFRRSDPYFMGKRTNDFLPGEEINFSEDKRGAPKFVGRRDPPYFVGKRESSQILENYLAELASEDDDSSLLEGKRAAPKFIGRRGAPYFVGKREAPMFVGKRIPSSEFDDDAFLPLEDKRGAPKFIGRRGAPYFVGKRGPSNYAGNHWTELSPEDDLSWLLENNKGTPTFVGRRGAPYFVGKRGPPIFVGKRTAAFDLDEGESSLADDTSQAGTLSGRRGLPYYFISKRGAPKFIGKRWAEPDLQNKEPSLIENKRRAPKFVGRRGSPYFVGKRRPPQIVRNRLTAEEMQPILADKRGPPKFVGRRGSPYFVGKKAAPMFVGKRLADSEQLDQNGPVIADKRGPPKFVGRRGSPYFVGKKAAPKFVGKRAFNSIDDIKEGTKEKETGDFGKESNGYASPFQFKKVVGEDSDFLAEGKMESGSHQENFNRLQAIENLEEDIQAKTLQEQRALSQRRDEGLQNSAAQETEEQR